MTPRWSSPKHLKKVTDLFERIRRGERVRAVVSTPPRHGKTETLIHGMAKLLDTSPRLQLTYISYATKFAEDKSRRTRETAQAAGVPLSKLAWARRNWKTGVEDGGLWATAINGQITGQGFHCMVVDDPVKDRATAESPTRREAHYEWFNDVAFTRLEPTGSCLVVQTRWHPDDLAGRLIRDGWACINLPALDEDNNPLWPERWDAETLLTIKAQIGDYSWSSLYMGAPRSRGGAVFQDVQFYDALPSSYRIGIGVDLAYSAKKHADWSVAVVLAESEGIYYVLDVIRRQVKLPVFSGELRMLKASHPGARIRWYTSSIEKEIADLVREQSGVPLTPELASGDKFIRAQPVAAAWNDKRALVRCPQSAPWLAKFVEELASFTGVNDPHDDQVDALAAAFDVLDRGSKLKTLPRAFPTKIPRTGGPLVPKKTGDDAGGKFTW